MPKKIAALTMIRNEEEIIESFVRYNMNFIDAIYFIYDNACTDNTLNILQLLKDEGYNIFFRNEGPVTFAEYILRNKYLCEIAAEDKYDFVMPLDADEFISCRDGSDPRIELEKLPENMVTYIPWRTFVLRHEDDKNEKFIPRKLTYYRDEKYMKCFKTVIPVHLFYSNKVYLNAGSHEVNAEGIIGKKYTDNLMYAHFPVVSEEQFEAKVCISLCNQINHKRQHSSDGNVQLRMYENWKNRKTDAYQDSLFYALSDEEKRIIDADKEIYYGPLNLKWVNDIDIKYPEMAVKVPEKDMLDLIEVKSILIYMLQIEQEEHKGAPKILVYGTGAGADNILGGLDKRFFDIRAYINTDRYQEFTYYKDRMVITPERIRCFRYDWIIISSEQYYDEMKEALIKNNVSEDKIFSKNRLVQYVIDKGEYI